MNDTNPEMRKKQLEIIFRMTPRQRFEEGLEMIDFVRNTVENSIKNKKPDISATQLKIEIFKRYYQKDFSESERTSIIQHFLTLKHPREEYEEEKTKKNVAKERKKNSA